MRTLYKIEVTLHLPSGVEPVDFFIGPINECWMSMETASNLLRKAKEVFDNAERGNVAFGGCPFAYEASEVGQDEPTVAEIGGTPSIWAGNPSEIDPGLDIAKLGFSAVAAVAAEDIFTPDERMPTLLQPGFRKDHAAQCFANTALAELPESICADDEDEYDETKHDLASDALRKAMRMVVSDPDYWDSRREHEWGVNAGDYSDMWSDIDDDAWEMLSGLWAPEQTAHDRQLASV